MRSLVLTMFFLGALVVIFIFVLGIYAPNAASNPTPTPPNNPCTTDNNGGNTDGNNVTTDQNPPDDPANDQPGNTGNNFEAPPLDFSNEKLVRGQGITIDMTRQQIDIEGSICRQQGLLEFLAIVPKSGKDHESLLYFECNPIHLNLALIMLGMVSTPQVQQEGEMKELKGDKVVIEVTFEFNGKKVTRRAEDLIMNTQNQKPMPRVGFVYTGSTFFEVPKKGDDGKWHSVDVYGALATGIMVAIYHHPAAVLDNPMVQGGDDTVWYARYDQLPPRWTKASIIIRRPKKGEVIPVPKEMAPK